MRSNVSCDMAGFFFFQEMTPILLRLNDICFVPANYHISLNVGALQYTFR